MKQYELYSAEDFINDPDFQDWIFHPNGEKEKFWQEVLSIYPNLNSKMEEAKLVLQHISFGEDWPSAEQVEKALQQTLLKINETPQKGKLLQMRPVLRWLSVAAILTILVGGYLWFNTKQSNQQRNIAAVKNQQEVIVPGGDKAILTLADGTNIVLDSAGNGTVTNQGNVKVIKLNGAVTYELPKGADKTQVVYNTITTPKGGQYQLVLADGSKVWLNAASSLRYPTVFNETNRVVELTGEGYFEVTHNPQRPFHVKTGDVEVAVLGTHFNINSYADEPMVKTTLTQGRVKVSKAGNYVFLNPGQQAITQHAKEDDQIRIQNNIDADEVLAWKDGKFAYNGADIKTIMRQAARWYDVDVVYKGNITEMFSGTLPRSENIEELLKILEATSKVKFEINGKEITVKSE